MEHILHLVEKEDLLNAPYNDLHKLFARFSEFTKDVDYITDVLSFFKLISYNNCIKLFIKLFLLFINKFLYETISIMHRLNDLTNLIVSLIFFFFYCFLFFFYFE